MQKLPDAHAPLQSQIFDICQNPLPMQRLSGVDTGHIKIFVKNNDHPAAMEGSLQHERRPLLVNGKNPG